MNLDTQLSAQINSLRIKDVRSTGTYPTENENMPTNQQIPSELKKSKKEFRTKLQLYNNR
jgi:hypothetical protein